MAQYKPGIYQVSGKGFGGDIKVAVTFDETNITEVSVIEHKETPGIGSKAIEALPNQYVEKNSADIDAVTTASVTSHALNEAVQNAINEAQGMDAPVEQPMADGVYTSKVKSYEEEFGLATGKGHMTLEVEVKDNEFKDIKVLECTDTTVIGEAAFDILTEEVLETQSLNLDSISGATVSSQAYFKAMDDVVTQAGGSATALKNKEVEKRPSETVSYDADVVIIGAGMAGLVATLRAAQNGLDAVLLERHQVLSSSTTRSVGYVVGADTEIQKKQGVEDTTDALYHDITSQYAGEDQLDDELMQKLTHDSKEMIQYLIDNGVEFDSVVNVSPVGYRKTKRTHTTVGGGAGLSEKLMEAAEKSGARIMMGTEVKNITMDKGAVTGVKATNKFGDDITFNADAVINCAGSYSNNLELLQELNPRVVNAEYICGSGDGDAYYFTKEVGGDIVDIEYPQMMYYYYSPTWDSSPEVLPGSPDVDTAEGIMVSGGGERVYSEEDFTFEFVEENWRRGYNEGYAVVDQRFADKYPETIKTALTTTVSVSGLAFGYKEDTVEALAENVGIDPEVLRATVDRYNAFCEKGVDEDFGKDPQYLDKLEAPYYIIRLPQIVTDGYTGARIDENSQVINEHGAPVKGAYAVGSAAAGQMTGINYFGCGTSLMICGVYGMAAADHIASKVKEPA